SDETISKTISKEEKLSQKEESISEKIEQKESLAIEEPINKQEIDLGNENFQEKIEKIKPASIKFNFESFIGEKLLNVIGAIALIVGIGFFLKYAFEQNWINETVRVALGVGFGGILLYGGYHYFKKSYIVFSQGLVGAGIAILYLSFYAAYNFYTLIPYSIAIVLMLVVTILSFYKSIYYNSLTIAILGVLGGFITPFILTVENPTFIGLFSYLAFINILIVLMLYKKDNWRSIEFIGLITTFLIYFIWYFREFQYENFFISLVFITVIALMYYCITIYRISQPEIKYKTKSLISGIILVSLYYLSLYELVDVNYPAWSGFSVILLALFILASSIALKKRYGESFYNYDQNVITAIVLSIIATEIQFAGFKTIILYSVEALLLVISGLYWNKGYLWKMSMALFAITIIKLVFIPGTFYYQPIADFIPIFNLRSSSILILIGSLGISSYLINSNLEIKYKYILVNIINSLWSFILFVFLGIGVLDYYRKVISLADNHTQITMLEFSRPLMISFLWTLYSLILLFYGLKQNIITFKISGTIYYLFALALLLMSGLIFEPLEQYVPIINIRFVVVFLFIASTILLTKWLKKFSDNLIKVKLHTLISLLRYTFAILLFILLTVEINDYFSKKLIIETGDITEVISYYRPLILSFVWTLFSVAFIYLGTSKRLKGYIVIGFVSLLLSIVFGLFIGYTFSPISFYSPGLNLRFITLTAIIIGVVLIISFIKKEKDFLPWNRHIINILTICASMLIFLCMSFELNDFYKKEMIALNSAVLSDNDSEITFIRNQKQFTMSILWLIY
ncbi:MAG: DUF2339 domain-containing protein, partial [Cyanobacteriota bacterium]